MAKKSRTKAQLRQDAQLDALSREFMDRAAIKRNLEWAKAQSPSGGAAGVLHIEIGPVDVKSDYYRYVASFVLLVLGISLMLEHLVTWGGFDPGLGAGHELYGLISVIVGYFIGIGIRFRRKKNETDR